jgi:hypothetical protein
LIKTLKKEQKREDGDDFLIHACIEAKNNIGCGVKIDTGSKVVAN